PPIVGPEWLGQGVDRRLQRCPTLGVEPSVDAEHAARLADEELAPLEVLLHSAAEAFRVDPVPGADRNVFQIFDRELAGVADPHLLVDPSPDLDRKSTRLNSSHQIISY